MEKKSIGGFEKKGTGYGNKSVGHQGPKGNIGGSNSDHVQKDGTIAPKKVKTTSRNLGSTEHVEGVVGK